MATFWATFSKYWAAFSKYWATFSKKYIRGFSRYGSVKKADDGTVCVNEKKGKMVNFNKYNHRHLDNNRPLILPPHAAPF